MISVSIIIPVYNVSRYIRRCLHSVINQTYAGPMECIIVDDRGQDDSMEKVAEILKDYEGPIKFHTIIHEENMGLSEARNSGIRQATGDYLLFIDSDDELTHSAVELLAAQVEKHPGVDMVYGQFYCAPYEFPSVPYQGPEYLGTPEECKRAMLRFRILPGYAHNKLIRRSFVVDHQLFFERGLLIEDNMWMWLISKNIESIAVVKEATYVYYKNPGSIMNNQKNNVRKIESWLKILSRKCDTLDHLCGKEQLRHTIEILLNVDSDIRYILEGDERRSRLDALKGMIKKLQKHNSSVRDLRTFLSLLCLKLELNLPITVGNRLFWTLHRASKMFVVWPKP